ncbi:MAG TPA: VWA domain-containing protein [Polyangiaceae bacterium]|nr:VWA domain-containing protein [Polyangiaceae bacterium]
MRNWAWAGALGCALGAVACSSTDTTGTCKGSCRAAEDDGGLGGESGGSRGGASGATSGLHGDETGGGTSLGGAPGSGGAPNAGGLFGAGGFDPGAGGSGGVCAGTVMTRDLLPPDVYVMFDQSSSMSDPTPGNATTWWDAMSAGFEAFVDATGAAGANVGVQYFPLGGIAPASCNAGYATPEVELGLLPGNATALKASVESHAPTGFTPTGPALSGAIAHMKTWAASHPGRAPMVALVTDGFPTECDPQQITDVAAIAEQGFTTDPVVRTFVVAMNLGGSASSMGQIAKAGGGSVFTVDSGDLAAGLRDALLDVLTPPPLGGSCDLPLPSPPSGQAIDPTKVNVVLGADATHPGEENVPRVSNVAECISGGGWYYDDPVSPTKIDLCPATCAGLGGRSLSVLAYCGPTPRQTP